MYPAMGYMPGMGQSPLRGRGRVSKGKQRRTTLSWPYGGSLGAITATTHKFPLGHLRSVKQNTRSELDCERTSWNIRYWNLLFLQHSSLFRREPRTPAGAKQSQTNTSVTEETLFQDGANNNQFWKKDFLGKGKGNRKQHPALKT